MKVTDEMVEVALKQYNDVSHGDDDHSAMRAALEAALGQFMLRYGDNVELQEAEQVGFRRAAACTEDLAGALNEMIKTQAEWEESVSQIIGRHAVPFERVIDRARATLERWGLK